MKLLSKLAIVGAAVATLGLSSTAAFAQTTGNIPSGNTYGNCSPNQPGGNLPTPGPVTPKVVTSQAPPQGSKNCQPPAPPKPGDPCTTGWDQGHNGVTFDSYTQQDNGGWLDSSCKPAPKPKPDPCGVHGRTPWVSSYTWQDGRYVQCCKPSRPAPVRCQCKVQDISFLLPTYGTWLKETSGPALFNGEIVKYDGSDWTVGDWTTPPSPKANGSQGKGDYFTLTPVLGGPELDGHGIKPEHATTICRTPIRTSSFPSL